MDNPPEAASIARADFHQAGDNWIVTKYTCKGRESVYLPISRKVEPGFDIHAALAWCRSNGWAVREWPGGARAWRNGVEPVRSAQRAERMRRDGLLVIDPAWAEDGWELDKFNLQFDL